MSDKSVHNGADAQPRANAGQAGGAGGFLGELLKAFPDWMKLVLVG